MWNIVHIFIESCILLTTVILEELSEAEIAIVSEYESYVVLDNSYFHSSHRPSERCHTCTYHNIYSIKTYISSMKDH